MEQYIIRHRELRELLLLIASVIRKPICFYDVRGNCLTCPPADSAPSGEYCMERRRKDPAFLDACIRCDMEHIRNAEKTGIISVYRCHAGLYDCVVPIFNPDGRFPGGFIVGQQRAAAAAAGPPGEGSSSAGSAAATPPALAHETQNQKILYEKLDEVTSEQLLNVGRLLKHLSEYLLSHELVGCRKLPWANAVDRYLKNHCDKNVTLDEVARAAGCSKSFLTHRSEKTENGIRSRRPEGGTQREKRRRKNRFPQSVHLFQNVQTILGNSAITLSLTAFFPCR